MPVIDFTGLNEKLPAGTYNLMVTKIEDLISSNGNPMAKWTFAVSKGPYEHLTLRENTPLTGKGTWKVASFLEAIGIDLPNGPVDIDWTECIGRELSADVEMTTYEGRERPTIKKVYPLSS